MGKRFNRSDPTAYQAIGNVDRDRKRGDLHYVQPPGRKLAREFPEPFRGLIPRHGIAVGYRAIELAGGRALVEEHHLNQARAEHDRRERGDDGGDAA